MKHLLLTLDERLTSLPREGNQRYHEIRSTFRFAQDKFEKLEQALNSLDFLPVDPFNTVESLIFNDSAPIELVNYSSSIDGPEMVLISLNQATGLPQAQIDLGYDFFTNELFLKLCVVRIWEIEGQLTLVEGPILLKLLLDEHSYSPELRHASTYSLEDLDQFQLMSVLRSALLEAGETHVGLRVCGDCSRSFPEWSSCPQCRNFSPPSLEIMQRPIELASGLFEQQVRLLREGDRLRGEAVIERLTSALGVAGSEVAHVAYVNKLGNITHILEFQGLSQIRGLQLSASGIVWKRVEDHLDLISATYKSEAHLVFGKPRSSLTEQLEKILGEGSGPLRLAELESFPTIQTIPMGSVKFTVQNQTARF